MNEPPRLLLGKGQTVRARIEIDVRKIRLDVLTHLDRTLMQEGFAVVEEIDAAERRPGFVNDSPKQIEIEHAGLTRAGDAGFGCAAGIRTGNIAGRRALDEHPVRNRACVERSDSRLLLLLQRQLDGTVLAEF